MGFRLRKARCLRRLSIRQAAKEAKISPIRLSQWERDIRKPSVDSLVRLAVVYWVMMDELCYDMRQTETKARDARLRAQRGEDAQPDKEKPP